MPPAKKTAAEALADLKTPVETPVETPVDDPAAQYIVYREPITSQVDVPGQGPTAVQSYKEHRVLLSEWPAYEKALNESKKGF